MSPYDPANPLGGDHFQIAQPLPRSFEHPYQRQPMKRAVPEVDDLFATQRALVRTINCLRGSPDEHDIERALERAEGAYKLIRQWLAKHGNEGRAW